MVRSILAIAAVLSVGSISLAVVMPTPEQMCEAAKLKLVGMTAGCELGIAANPKKGNDFTQCTTGYSSAFPKVGTCSGDQAGLETQVETFRSDIAAALTPNTSKCEVGKIKAAKQKLKCELFAEAQAVRVAGTADFTKCTANFATAFMKLEAAPKEDCTTTGDETAIEDAVDAFRGTVVAEIIPSTTTTTTSSTTTTTIFTSSPHLPFPQMPRHGQPPLSQLQLVTVTFGAYPFQSFVESFGDFVVTSQWLAAVTQDFGPITATHLAKVNLPAGAFNSDLGSVLLNNIGGALPYPADPTGLLYLFYQPRQPSPCTTAGGYHSSVTFNGRPVAYAVALNCSDGESAEGVATHEIAEVLTDAYFQGEFFDVTSAPWVGEVGDICNDSPWWIEGGFRFGGNWSNTAAAAGGSPCVPWAAGHPYYNVSPSPSAPQIVPAGSSATFTLTGWSTGPVAPWTVRVTPDLYAPGFDTKPSFTTTTINNGSTTQLTLHVPAGTPSGDSATVRVQSELPDVVEGVTGFSADWSLQVIAQ